MESDVSVYVDGNGRNYSNWKTYFKFCEKYKDKKNQRFNNVYEVIFNRISNFFLNKITTRSKDLV